MRTCIGIAFLAVFCLTCEHAAPQASVTKDVIDALDKHGGAVLKDSGIEIRAYDYECDGAKVEAITFRPPGEGPFPGLVLIPGYGKSARDYISLRVRFAKEGFACVAITQPGFGRSDGPPDFVGPKTVRVLEMGYERFKKEPHVDSGRMGLFGYSRGAMAASLLAVRLTDVKAAVLGAGIYDLQKAYDEVEIDGIRINMKLETGWTDEAIGERSSARMMEKLSCPVLILHGEKDKNSPVSQAYLLRDRLKELGKEFEIHIFPDREHDIGMQNLLSESLDFFRRKLMPAEE